MGSEISMLCCEVIIVGRVRLVWFVIGKLKGTQMGQIAGKRRRSVARPAALRHAHHRTHTHPHTGLGVVELSEYCSFSTKRILLCIETTIV